MINNVKFNLATGGNTYNVVPLVVITNNDIVNYFSTYNFNLEELSFDPLLLNVSSIKESVDVETRKYKTSSVTITLSNAKYLGRRLSDSYEDIINGDVEIYFKTQNITDLARAMLVYKGKVKRISQTDTTITLSVEDSSEQKIHKDIPESLTDEINFKSKYKNKPYPMVIGKVDRSPCITAFTSTAEYDLEDSGFLDEYDFVQDVYADKKELTKIVPENIQIGGNLIGSTSLYVDIDKNYVGLYPRNEVNFESGLEVGDINYTPLSTNNGYAFVSLFKDNPTDDNQDNEIDVDEIAQNDTAANKGRVLYPRKEFKIQPKIKHKGVGSNFTFKSGQVSGNDFIADEVLDFSRINDGNPNTCIQIEGSYIMSNDGEPDPNFSHAYLKFYLEPTSSTRLDTSEASTWTRIIAKTEIVDRSIYRMEFYDTDPNEQNRDYLYLPILGVFSSENDLGGKIHVSADPTNPSSLRKSTLSSNDETRMLVERSELQLGGDEPDFPEFTGYFYTVKPAQIFDTQENLQQVFATNEKQYNSFQSHSDTNPISMIHPSLVPDEASHYCLGLPKINRVGDEISNIFLGYQSFEFNVDVKFRIYESHLWAFGTVTNLLSKDFYANVWGRKSEINIYSAATSLYPLNANHPVQQLFDAIVNGTDSAEEIYNNIDDAIFDSSPVLTSEMPYSFTLFPIKAVGYDASSSLIPKEIDITRWGFSISLFNDVYYFNFDFEGFTKDENFADIFNIQLGNLDGEIVNEFQIAIDTDKENILISPIENPAEIVKHILEEECKYDGEFNDEEFNAIKELHPDWNFAFTQSKLISSKKLIEDFSRSTKSFPRFRADGTFGWNVVKDTYSDDDIDLVIEESDIINYKYDRTKLEDVKTKVKVLFNIDYAKGNHLFSTDDILATDYVNASIYQYYGLATDDSDSTLNFETDYIRDRYTAEQLRNWLLTWNMNQKNLISLTLPIKYIKLEVGDVVALDKEIQGTKMFGETYTQTIITRNAQEIYPYFMVYETNKNLEKVDIKLIQLHNLDINSLGTVEEPEAQQEESNIVLPTGDVNGDGNTDVVDIVSAIGYILGAKELTDEEFFQADINQDGNVDVLDVVTLVNIILG